ncbi:MAG: carboxypeptidase regulatory-like domain-containing protein [Bacteroidales bacterium]|nr:carboxypeptidase regulatory-like domain-containing protein [Bacteroidales bacterium]
MRQSIRRILLVIAAIFASVVAFGQVTTSSLNGRITDDNGEALAGAAVIAIHTPSGTQYYSSANVDGRFVINGMRSGGPYKVEVSFIGMNTVQYNDVVLKLGEAFELNTVMTSSNELDAVTVVAEKSFNANQTGAGTSWSRASIESTPMIDRSVNDVVKYTPLASINKSGGISFGGANNRYNSIQIDGAVANDTFGLSSSGTNGGLTGANPFSLDAIEEIQVVIAPFDVRQSGFTGGAINAITKAGTNEYKGSAYTYFLNENFIGTTAGKDVENRTKYSDEAINTYGFTAGGPIIKNKLFLFVSGEYYKKEVPNVYSPSNGSYDAKTLSEEVVWNGVSYGNVFNEAMAAAMIQKYEETYGVSNTGESYGEHKAKDRSINALARLDWNINKTNKLMFRYQLADAYADKYGSGAYTYYFNNSSYKMSNTTNTFVAELNSQINDEMSNMFRASAVLVRDKRDCPYNGANIYIQDNVAIDLGTEYSSGANSMDSNTFTITDNFSWYKGNHEITFGTHNEIYSFKNLFLQYVYGGYTYNSINDFFNDTIKQFNYRYSDPELTGGDTRWAATTRAAQIGLYAQDEWKPNTNFTLTYGLRMDIPMLLNKPTKNPTFNETTFATANNQYVGVVPKKTPLWSPRVGFRWFTDDTHKTLLRGGVGLFTGRVPFVWLSNAYNNTGMESKSISKKNPGSIPLTSDPYNDIVLAGVFSASGSGATINTLSDDFKYPQVLRADLAFEKELFDGWKFTAEGLFSKTLNNVFFNNLAVSKSAKTYAVSSDVDATAPYYSVSSGDYSAIVALGNTNKGYSYNLSGKIEKSFPFGLDLMASYTFGHSYSVNDGTSSVAYSNWKYNYSLDTNAEELSYSLFDHPHKVQAVVSYTTPVYLGFMSSSISVTYTGESGQRFCYTMKESKDFNGDGQYGNSVMYIPTQDEIALMTWADTESAAQFEALIQGDDYLSSHRGQWSERYAGIAPFENHFDVHFTQDFIYDKAKGRKVQFIVDLLNASNLLNRSWGMYYASAYNRQILSVTAMTQGTDGNYTPTYKYLGNELTYSDFYSRWRLQFGLRLTF